MTKSTTVISQKKRGPAPTGKGEPVLVRLQPNLMAILDDLALEVGVSRPEALRLILSQWAESYGHLPPKERLRERSIMLSIDKSVLAKLDEISGDRPYDEVIELALSEWIEHLKKEEGE